jgi:hypothetical protein
MVPPRYFFPAQNQPMRQCDFLTFWRGGGISVKSMSDKANDVWGGYDCLWPVLKFLRVINYGARN